MNHNLLKIIFLVILIMTFGSCKKINTSQVIEYNNQIVNDQKLILQYESKLYNAIYDNANIDTLKSILKEYQLIIDSINSKYQNPFKIEDTMRKVALSLFDAYKSIAYNEYPYLISLIDSANKGAIIDSDEIMKILVTIDSTEQTANMSYIDLQQYIVNKYKIDLINSTK